MKFYDDYLNSINNIYDYFHCKYGRQAACHIYAHLQDYFFIKNDSSYGLRNVTAWHNRAHVDHNLDLEIVKNEAKNKTCYCGLKLDSDLGVEIPIYRGAEFTMFRINYETIPTCFVIFDNKKEVVLKDNKLVLKAKGEL